MSVPNSRDSIPNPLAKNDSISEPVHSSVVLTDFMPVILTCSASLPYVGEFVDSYRLNVGNALPSPRVIIDISASNHVDSTYILKLTTIQPSSFVVHPRVDGCSFKDSVNDAAFFALEFGLKEMKHHKYLLFIEDDIIFSSQFTHHLSQLVWNDRIGLLSLYSPSSGYRTEIIEPYRFYGTQCVIIPRYAVSLILNNRAEMERRFSPNYDMRWAQYLGACGYEIRATPKSFVQHIGRRSRIGCNFHASETFAP